MDKLTDLFAGELEVQYFENGYGQVKPNGEINEKGSLDLLKKKNKTLLLLPPKEVKIKPGESRDDFKERIARIESLRRRVAELYKKAGLTVLMGCAPFINGKYHIDPRKGAWPWMEMADIKTTYKVKAKSKRIYFGNNDTSEQNTLKEDAQEDEKKFPYFDWAPEYNHKIMTYAHPAITQEIVMNTKGEEIVTFTKMLEDHKNLYFTYFAPDQIFKLLDCFRRVASALEFMHSKNIAHGDIKPDNILVKDPERYSSTDALLFDMENSSPVGVYSKYGTKEYSEDSIWKGKGVSVDNKSDIFALGVTLIEKLGIEPKILANAAKQGANDFEKRRILSNLLNKLRVDDKNLREELGELIFSMIQNQKDMRPSAQMVFATLNGLINKYQPKQSKVHPWLAVATAGLIGIGTYSSLKTKFGQMEETNPEKTFCTELQAGNKIENHSFPPQVHSIADAVTMCRDKYGFISYDPQKISERIVYLSTINPAIPSELLKDAKRVKATQK